jgi:hypothetical protein
MEGCSSSSGCGGQHPIGLVVTNGKFGILGWAGQIAQIRKFTSEFVFPVSTKSCDLHCVCSNSDNLFGSLL